MAGILDDPYFEARLVVAVGMQRRQEQVPEMRGRVFSLLEEKLGDADDVALGLPGIEGTVFDLKRVSPDELELSVAGADDLEQFRGLPAEQIPGEYGNIDDFPVRTTITPDAITKYTFGGAEIPESDFFGVEALEKGLEPTIVLQ